MPLFILAETSAGYAIFKSSDKKLLARDDYAEKIKDAEGAQSILHLKQFQKFENSTMALDETAALIEGKVTPMLSSLLEDIKSEKKASSLVVSDPKLANAINKLPQLSIKADTDSNNVDLFRAIRTHLPSLIPALLPAEGETDHPSSTSLGLAHGLSRYKLRFSADKVDTMIIQAVSLLDDLDKELNIYAMRVKEWYGWHFPEMAKIINDNLAYAKVVLHVGMRSRCAEADMSDILPEEIEVAVKAAAEVSMGTEVTQADIITVQALAEQVVALTEGRQQLSSYLTSRMQAVAPNLTALVGDLVGARLISHAGGLMNLAKSPGSTVQIIGAEKALFRALKKKQDTPKYGVIFHASLVGQATGKNKGKIARMLASKAALSLRVDSLSDWGANGEGVDAEPSEEEKAALGNEWRAYLERRLSKLEGRSLVSKGVAIGPGGETKQPGKWEIKEARKYNRDADGLKGDEPAATKITTGLKTPRATPKDKVPVANGIEDHEDDEAMEVDETEVNGAGKKELSKEERKALKRAEKEAKRKHKEEKLKKRKRHDDEEKAEKKKKKSKA
ncbi:Nop domain-containing protein [Rhizodiscina lignyota]|uniref:Nucleolar protein 58 n=1 Tax=Rhizodiscina lignyota TaxID=1504668 RepID=A0A9P4I8K7_9PEZI|nr:Nop domain-containing protein [Rhizodiscina lignyota]